MSTTSYVSAPPGAPTVGGDAVALLGGTALALSPALVVHAQEARPCPPVRMPLWKPTTSWRLFADPLPGAAVGVLAVVGAVALRRRPGRGGARGDRGVEDRRRVVRPRPWLPRRQPPAGPGGGGRGRGPRPRAERGGRPPQGLCLRRPVEAMGVGTPVVVGDVEVFREVGGRAAHHVGHRDLAGPVAAVRHGGRRAGCVR